MDLACTENLEKACIAKTDRYIFGDIRVLHNLLKEEISSVPSCDYFETVQNDIQPFMRKVVTTWMLEVRGIFRDFQFYNIYGLLVIFKHL